MSIAYHAPEVGVAPNVARATPTWVNSYPVAEESFGELLRRLRDREGLSQEEFAKAVGLSRKSIYAIENNIGRPQFTDEIGTVTKMAAVLRKPVSVLSIRLGWMPAAECVDWRAGLLADKRLTDEDRDALSTVIQRFGL